MKAATDFLCPRAGEVSPSPASLPGLLAEMASRCTDCRACVRHCAFLQQHGSPGIIATALLQTAADCQIAYACSLCGLCQAVCPEGLDPCALFLAMRRHQVEAGKLDARPYRPLLFYEWLGRSPLLSAFVLPSGCTTVFFPGCALPGSRPAVTWRIYRHLRQHIPNLGMVLHCCTKPSHDLGRSSVFAGNFAFLLDKLRNHGISTLLTACPNCTRMFQVYGADMQVKSIFTLLHQQGGEPHPDTGQEVCIHDPCPLRADRPYQEAVRDLLRRHGYRVRPMRHQHHTTICCGEGGAVGFRHPQLAQAWSQKRVADAAGRLLITTCAGCTTMLGTQTPTLHLADLLFPPTKGKKYAPAARPPLTYVNRLLLKLRLCCHM